MQVFPSHGKGHKFDPCSAHHLSRTYRQGPAQAGRTIREHADKIGGKSAVFLPERSRNLYRAYRALGMSRWVAFRGAFIRR